MSIFGTIGVADDLEDAVLATLQSWFPVYVKEVELQQEIAVGSLPDPKSWLTSASLDRDAADATPAIVVVSPGLSPGKHPVQEGDGSFRVYFSIGIGVFVSANDRENTMSLVRLYTAICRSILLHKQSLGGYADGVTWLDESYDDSFSFTDSQTIMAGQVIFEIEVGGFGNRYGGPAGSTPPNPATQPGSEWPLVATVTSTVKTK